MESVATRLGPLEARVVQAEPGTRPGLAVVLCHGFGASGTDLVPLAGELFERQPALAAQVRFVFPAAPLTLAGFGWGDSRAWWPIDLEATIALRASGAAGRAEARNHVPEGLATARRQLASCVEAVAQTSGLSPGRIVLGGFSQGGMITTDLALRQEEAPAALVILSGTIVTEADWRARAERRKGLRVLQSHGRQDPILPFQDAVALRDLLTAAGLNVEFIPFDGPHTIPEQALDRLGALLVSLLESSSMTERFRRFSGTDRYLTSAALQAAVNCALVLERPLLVKGEPGTGKTLLADAVAEGVGCRLLTWNVKSTSRAQDGLYLYDTVQRLYDSRFGDGDVRDIRRYIRFGPLGEAFRSPDRVVLLIDEVDKADLEFPNDLLHELDRMRFRILETDEEVVAKHRPVVIVTSNNEKELPDAFLRRCVFHFIDFPERELMQRIVRVHHPKLDEALVDQALDVFYQLRDLTRLRKRPSTSELVDWLAVLKASGVRELKLDEALPFVGALLKREQDLLVFQESMAAGRRPRA